MHDAHKHLIGALAYLFLQALSLFVSPSAYGQYDTQPLRAFFVDSSGRQTDERKSDLVRVIYPLWKNYYPFEDYHLTRDTVYARGFVKDKDPDITNQYKKVGPYITFYRSLSPSLIGNYDSLGRKEGGWNYLNERGDTIKRQFYNANRLENSTCYADDGKIIHHGENCSEVAAKPLNMDEVKRKIDYPRDLRDRLISGSVLVCVLVRKDGTVDPNSIKRYFATHDGFFNEVAGKLPGLRFSPYQIHGKPSHHWITIPFNFMVR